MRPRLEVTVSRDRISAEVKRGRRTVWSGECLCSEREGLPDLLASLRRRDDFPTHCQDVRFVVEPPLAQLRTLRALPPVRSSELRRVVDQQSNRFFRRRSSALIVDAKWQDRRGGSAYAGAIDGDLVDLLRRTAAEWNMTLTEVAATNHGENARTLRFTGTNRQTKRLLRAVTVTSLVSAWIGGSYLTGYLIDLDIDRRRLASEVRALRPDLDMMDAARREIAKVVTVVGTLEERDARRGWVTRLLARLAEALPQSAHIVSVSGTPEDTTIRLRARALDSATDSLVSSGLGIVVEGEGDPAAIDEEGDEWQAVTIRLNGGFRAGS